MPELSYTERLLAAAAGKIPAAVIHQGDDERVYLVFNDEVGRAKDPLPLLTEWDWDEIEGIMRVEGRFDHVLTLAPQVAQLWPSTHMLFTPCSCCVELQNYRECWPTSEHAVPARRAA